MIPEQVYRYIVARADFMRSPDVKNAQVNIIFMTYRLEDDPMRPGEFRPALVTVEGTSHSSLQNAILYRDAPAKDAFTAQIKRSLVRAVNLADLIAQGEVGDEDDTRLIEGDDPQADSGSSGSN